MRPDEDNIDDRPNRGRTDTAPINLTAADVMTGREVATLLHAALPDTTHIYEYAAIFGFSQQGFTRLVDEKAQALTGSAPPRASGALHAAASHGSGTQPPEGQ
jgi:hypothetical protein